MVLLNRYKASAFAAPPHRAVWSWSAPRHLDKLSPTESEWAGIFKRRLGLSEVMGEDGQDDAEPERGKCFGLNGANLSFDQL
ncbi:hypothetical protein SAMN00790413_04838 [Deinococcus hopiensis KR-140]|uniref:Uncharacterized protein n=1 Tax=Deinococcus hopiensis KR-140 TaxID=695939 RepID=A0A1W1UM03_9DEIO|nr:hypothetical protein SAMN00790413_04838 [Deinococcus hopiensis KR-140]